MKPTAVVLARGASLAQYDQEKHKNSFVIAVNATMQHYAQEFGEPLRVDLLFVQDPPIAVKQRAPKTYEAVLQTPEEVKMQFINKDWLKVFPDRSREKIEIISGGPLPRGSHSMKLPAGKRIGNLSVVTAILEAYRLGYTNIEVYGHDCSPDYQLFGGDNTQNGSPASANAVRKTIEELNRIHEGLKLEKGSLALASSSYLWQITAPDYRKLTIDKCGEEERETSKKTTRKRRRNSSKSEQKKEVE